MTFNLHDDSRLTVEMLAREWEKISRQRPVVDFNVKRMEQKYAILMLPYLHHPLPILRAAHTLAASTVHKQLPPAVVEKAKAVLNAAGLEWGKEGPNQ